MWADKEATCDVEAPLVSGDVLEVDFPLHFPIDNVANGLYKERAAREMEMINAAAALDASITRQNTPALQTLARMLNTDYRDGAEIVFDAILGELSSRLPEDEFVAFCENLEA